MAGLCRAELPVPCANSSFSAVSVLRHPCPALSPSPACLHPLSHQCPLTGASCFLSPLAFPFLCLIVLLLGLPISHCPLCEPSSSFLSTPPSSALPCPVLSSLSPSMLFLPLCTSLQAQSSSWRWGPGLESLMFASSFCYGFWIQHIWIPGPRCVVATATSVPLVNTGAHPLQSREQNNCVTFFCHEIEMSSPSPPPPPSRLPTPVSRQSGETPGPPCWGVRGVLALWPCASPILLSSFLPRFPVLTLITQLSTTNGDHPILGNSFSPSLYNNRRRRHFRSLKFFTVPSQNLEEAISFVTVFIFPFPEL